MARKRYMEEAERVMLLMYSAYYNETGQIADNSNLKGAMTRGRNFAQAAIDGEVMKRLMTICRMIMKSLMMICSVRKKDMMIWMLMVMKKTMRMMK